jgi:uncharacterized membrane protein
MITMPANEALRFDHRRLRQVLVIVAVAISLHVIPQWLAAYIDPALSMTALMLVDAVVFAAVMRTTGAWRAVGVFAVIFAVTYVLRRSQIVALPSVVMNLMLATVFGWTLRAGHTPLIARIAAHAMGISEVPPRFGRYLRGLTLAWCVFFVVVAAISALLAAFAPFAWWSLFANVLSWPLVLLFFCVEYIVRRVFFRDLPNHTPLQTLAAALAMPHKKLL